MRRWCRSRADLTAYTPEPCSRMARSSTAGSRHLLAAAIVRPTGRVRAGIWTVLAEEHVCCSGLERRSFTSQDGVGELNAESKEQEGSSGVGSLYAMNT